MQFNSLEFFLFGMVFYSAWAFLRRWKHPRWLLLVAASFLFYGWFDWTLPLLLLASGCIDFFVALGMARYAKYRKLFLGLSILGNLGVLFTFKYLVFSVTSLNGLLVAMGLPYLLPHSNLVLPIGISFYTFQSMSYTFDVYRGRLEPTRHIHHFFAYLAMFPQLIAGPIVRAGQLLPQLQKACPITEQVRWEGLKLVVTGFFLKLVIADNLAPHVNAAFQSGTPAASALYWWAIMIMFTFQIYCDFNGYCHIARGLAKWMGYDFPVNFNHPFRATSLQNFWSRWHITLSSWFRDYVFYPLCNRGTKMIHVYLFLWASLVLSGLWHGAAWTFICWASIHFAFIMLEHQTRWPRKVKRLVGGKYICAVTVMLLFFLSSVFFRSESLSKAVELLQIMCNPIDLGVGVCLDIIGYRYLLLITIMLLYATLANVSATRNLTWPVFVTHRYAQCATVSLGMAACILLRGPANQFVYFQF
jgi:D-alanyl-lipoteichoic acid acyltransferase DltB (MBOAT superfamily)